jgi:hypothetical protein
MRFNTTTTKIEIFSNGVWLDLDTPPLISSVGYAGSTTAADPAGGETITIHGSNFSTPTVIKFRDTSTGVTTVFTGAVTLVNSTQLSITSQALPAADYDLLVESNGVTGVFSGGYTTNALPGWTTAAGNLGSVGGGTVVNITVAASETDGGPIAYSVTSGSLPTGLSLTTNVIGGTASLVGADTTSTFTMRAIDDEGQIADRTFNIVVKSEYILDNSLRFNDDDSAYLSRTPTTAGNRKTWTWSGWVKRGNIGTDINLLHAFTTGQRSQLVFATDDTIKFDFDDYTANRLVTSQKFRDPSAWYHIVLAVDTTIASPSGLNQRVKIYINGSQITDFSSASYPSLNEDGHINETIQHEISSYDGSGSYFDGYLAEVNFIDGQALNPTAFGKAHDIYGHWVPTIYSGTYGTNGFHLDFALSSTPAITDASGNYTPSIAGGTTHSTDKAKFGASSIKAGNANDNLTITNSGDVAPNGSNNITYECWVWWDGYLYTGTTLAYRYTPDYFNPNWTITTAGKLRWGNQTQGGGNLYYHESSNNLTANTWNHIATTISNKTVTHYINGTSGGSHTWTTGTWTAAGTLQLLRNSVDWYFDELRISNTIRYTSNFTPATSAFTSDANTKLLIHSDYSPSTSLGADNSTNSNHWTPNNLASTDQMLDTPTNNFATMNPLYWNPIRSNTGTYSEGNLKEADVEDCMAEGTIAATAGKWYYEVITSGDNMFGVGVVSEWGGNSPGGNSYGVAIHQAGDWQGEGSGGDSTAQSYSNGDLISIAYDLTNNKIWMAKNGVWSGNPSTNTGGAVFQANASSGQRVPAMRTSNGSGQYTICNFGQDSSFAGTKTSQNNADGNGYGDFYYAPPTGFNSLCTRNLPDPTVVPGAHFNVVTYAGDDSPIRTISGVGFQPGFTWVKDRVNSSGHYLWDEVRGTDKNIRSDGTWNETDVSNASGGIVSTSTSDGFITKIGSNVNNVNGAGNSYVAWNWKANGAGVSNTNGSITSTVSANAAAGFSIVGWTGNGVDNSTIGHGLSSPPDMIITKKRNEADSWNTYHKDLPAGHEIFLDQAVASSDDGNNGSWGDNHPSSVGASTYAVGYAGDMNATNKTYIAYCFHSVDGYSKMGSYKGNSSTDGAFVYTGFAVKYVMVHDITAGQGWWIFDNERDTNGNPMSKYLGAERTAAEYTGDIVDFVSNGFKLRHPDNAWNVTGDTYIFMAFAETPFKHSNAR